MRYRRRSERQERNRCRDRQDERCSARCGHCRVGCSKSFESGRDWLHTCDCQVRAVETTEASMSSSEKGSLTMSDIEYPDPMAPEPLAQKAHSEGDPDYGGSPLAIAGIYPMKCVNWWIHGPWRLWIKISLDIPRISRRKCRLLVFPRRPHPTR